MRWKNNERGEDDIVVNYFMIYLGYREDSHFDSLFNFQCYKYSIQIIIWDFDFLIPINVTFYSVSIHQFFPHSNQETQLPLSPKGTKEERIYLVGENNHLQEISRESYWDDDYDRGFSLIGLVESMISVVASGIRTVMNSIVGTEKKNSRSRVRKINYRNYQLFRIFPNTENHVADLRDLKDAEPEDIKFWSFPIPNKYVLFDE